MRIPFPAYALAFAVAGCSAVNRHAYFEPVPEEGAGAYTPKVMPIAQSDFHVVGILLPFMPFYFRNSPLIASLRFPSDLDSCPPVRIGRGVERDTVHASAIAYRSCHYELGDRPPDSLELDWGSRTLRTGFRREVDWSFRPFFIPTH